MCHVRAGLGFFRRLRQDPNETIVDFAKLGGASLIDPARSSIWGSRTLRYCHTRLTSAVYWISRAGGYGSELDDG